ncbi:hypothetical protein K461DRAFT_15973 [Myriangium duriaei CBS 260.36]|uniref:Uncharacterized protein n=1 Tax=Myriangium duriaei CBS 260.36 TaxID=1168546 RepID=A0A9P4J974_9PEZI|nr:hypothetical protein K461DRAFT_15973 [Myriangium duriaei CBS 260.36]
MSTAAKFTLLGTSFGALGIIVFVHYAQKADKAVCTLLSLSPSSTSVFFRCRYGHGPYTTRADWTSGDACGRHPGHGTAASEARASGRLRDAGCSREGISKSSNCQRRPCIGGSTMTLTYPVQLDRKFRTVGEQKSNGIMVRQKVPPVQIASNYSD